MRWVSISRGSNWARRQRLPPAAKAPRVLPWKLWRLVMNLLRPLSPRSTKYWRAIFSADSMASDPPLTKNTQSSAPGARSASFSARRSADSLVK